MANENSLYITFYVLDSLIENIYIYLFIYFDCCNHSISGIIKEVKTTDKKSTEEMHVTSVRLYREAPAISVNLSQAPFPSGEFRTCLLSGILFVGLMTWVILCASVQH